MKNNYQCNFNGVRMGGGSIEHPLSIHSASIGTRWKARGMQLICTLVLLFTFGIGNVMAELTAHTPGVYEKTTDKGGYGATIVTVSSRDYEVYGFSYNSSGTKPQILWAGTSTNNASDSHVLCSTLSTTPQEIAGWISMSTVSKSSTYSMPSGTEFAASSVGSTGLYQMKLQGHSFTIKVKGYDQFSFLGNDNNGDKSKGKYLQVYINGADSTKDVSSSTTVRRWTLNPSTTYTIVITGLGSSNEHIDAFSLRLPACQAPTTAFSEGAYTVGESALALSSLISGNNSDGAITYVVKTDGGTGASIAAGSFTATAAGTATITATQAADATHNKCEKIIDFNVVVTASSCAATIPGDISKGALTAGEITLTADGSAESGDTWYWQDAADGTATNLGTGATKNVNTAGTYYIRSYNTAGDCWSAAKSIEVTAEELLEHYAITYNKGEYGTGEIAGGEKVEGVAYTLSSDRFTRAGYVQVGWALTDGGAKAYDLGGSYTTDAAQTFYPVWAETSTYVASFNSGEGCSASTPAGWTFANAGSYGAEVATADYECKFGSTCPASGSAANASYIAFAKADGACATYDLGAATTVSALAGTFYVGSSNERTFTIEYLAANGTTVLHTISTTTNTNWGEKVVNDATVISNVKYIRINPAHNGNSYSWLIMKAFSVTYVDLVTKYNVSFDKNGGSGDDMATLKYAEGAEVTLPACTFTAPGSKEFDAWTSADVTIANNKFTMPNKNVTITATWKTATPKYHVYYNGNGASGTVPTDATAYEANALVAVLGKGDLARIIDGNAATFYGWNTKADMTGTHYDAGANFYIQNANVTLYAEWGYSIEYKLNNGSWKSGYTAPDHYIYGKGVTLPTAENVERVGFEFDGWYSEWHVNNQGGYINDNKRTAVGPSDYGNASYLASWTALPLGNAQSVDLEGLVENEGTGANWQAYMTSHGYEYSTESVSLDEKKDPSEDKAYDNWPYQGLKMKKTGSYVQGTVEAGKLVIIKLGHMAAAANVTIGGVAQEDATGLDAAEPAGQPNYYYVENESVLRYETTNDGACVLKAITITDPYTVSFAAHGDADPAALDGHPAVTLPTPTNGTASFLGWFTAETGGTKIGDAGESYTPSADITLHAQWEAISTDARLSAIEITPNTGVLSPAFNPEVTNYTYTMPYGTGAVPTITGATPNHEGATWYIESAATAWGETTIVRGKALSNDTKAYNITMLQAPKDGVAIISIDVPTGNGNVQTIAADNISGFIGGTATQKLQSGSKKLGGNSNYIGFTLANSEELQAGDVIRLNVSATNGASHLTLYQDGSDANLVKDIEWTATEGINLIPVPAEAVGLSTLYIYRTSSACNPTLSEFAILRPMDPVMTAITIDGRAGEIDPLDDKHFSVTIPFESELDNLTVVPEVVWNAAHATTPTAVVSNGGEWVLAVDGDNTYRVMDKDGDHTDYTITLTRDVKKYTVSFNTHDGSAVADELVAEGGYLAAAPADPTKEDYLFQYWSLTEDGAEVDVTTVQVNDDVEFHAIWKELPVYKLIIDGEGETKVINSEYFTTGATMGNKITVSSVQYDNARLSGTASDLTQGESGKYIAYSAQSNKTRIKIIACATDGTRSIKVHTLVEGATSGSTSVATYTVTTALETHEYVFEGTTNRTIYFTVPSDAGKVCFVQVKAIEEGETQLKRAGEAGYSLNLDKGRIFGTSSVKMGFEGITYTPSSKYTTLSSTALQTTNNISFQVNELVTMTLVSTGAKYQVSKNPAGSGSEYGQGTNHHTLTPGTWYIVSSTGSNIKFTNISFSEPVANYTRPVNPAYLGTLCWTNDAILGGATLYEFAGKNENNYLVFDEVEENRLEAGKPYIFMPENGNTEIKVYNIDESDPMTESQLQPVNNMYGTLDGKTLVPGVDDNMYYFSSNHIWAVKDFTVNIPILPNRCYIDYPAVLAAEPAPTTPAPGRRRVTMGVQGSQIATGMGEIEASETPMKVMIDGQLFIIRGEKMFDATGRLVK